MKRIGYLLFSILLLLAVLPSSTSAGSVFSWCGKAGQPTCFGACDPGAAPNINNLYYCTSCGSDGEQSCYGFCETGNVLDLSNLLYCTSCGGSGEYPCPLGGCEAGYSLDPNNLLSCVDCGGEGQPTCLEINADAGYCDNWLQPNLSNLLYCTSCGGPGELPCQPLATWIPNCEPGHEVFFNGTCEPCGTSFGPTCSPGPACGSRQVEIADAIDVFGVGIADALNLIDFLDIIPGVCIPCGEPGFPVCETAPKCNNPLDRDYLGFCQSTGYTEEPETDTTVERKTQPKDSKLWGWVDAHEHQFANEAYGGAVLWGKPFDEEGRGANAALAWCDYTQDFDTVLPPFVDVFPDIEGAESPFNWMLDMLNDVDGRGSPVHGSHKGQYAATQHAFGFTVNKAMDMALHDVTGVKGDPMKEIDAAMNQFNYPDKFLELFGLDIEVEEPWPNYKNGGHQQMYHKWLERAYEGGMRVLINMPVNNEVLCKLSLKRAGYSCDDMEAAYLQIEKIKELEAFIDYEDDHEYNDSGWYRIAYDPKEARTIIEEGAMAVVLSIEVDSLFGCKPGTEETVCTEENIVTELNKLYEAGVRHVFPVHLFDNAFAGAAYYGDVFSVANTLATWDYFQPVECFDEGYSFAYSAGSTHPNTAIYTLFWPLLWHEGDNVVYELPTLQEFSDIFYGSLDPFRKADCNSKGLELRGKFLLQELMKRGMLIDIDHFSNRALNGFDDIFGNHYEGVLEILKANNYPPVSSHTVIVPDLAWNDDNMHFAGEKARSELGITVSKAIEIAKMGGLLATNTPRNVPVDVWEPGTSRQFAQGQHAIYKDDAGNKVKSLRMLGYEDIRDMMKNAYDQHNQQNGYVKGAPDYLDPDFVRIGYSGDFGAFVKQPAPRFNEDGTKRCPVGASADPDGHACFDDAPGQGGELPYPFKMDVFFEHPNSPYTHVAGKNEFNRQVTGDRTFNLNTDGVAHIGLVPDLLADMEKNYDVDLTAFFSSAEAFVQLWESVWDTDGDGIAGEFDNCPDVANPDQANADGDGQGDLCDSDDDNDGVADATDLDIFNPNVCVDTDGDTCDDCSVGEDGFGPLADNLPLNDGLDTDSDGACNLGDDDDDDDGQLDAHEVACGSDPLIASSMSPDNDVDSLPDCVDPDDDNDGVDDVDDNCQFVDNADQANFDGDLMGDLCDPDDDNDLVPDTSDLCPFEDATGFDANNDGCIDTIQGLVDLLNTLVAEGVIDSNIANGLLSKVENALKSSTKENLCAVVGQIGAFRNQIEGQRGKKVSEDAADILAQYADNLTTQFLSKLPEGESCN